MAIIISSDPEVGVSVPEVNLLSSVTLSQSGLAALLEHPDKEYLVASGQLNIPFLFRQAVGFNRYAEQSGHFSLPYNVHASEETLPCPTLKPGDFQGDFREFAPGFVKDAAIHYDGFGSLSVVRSAFAYSHALSELRNFYRNISEVLQTDHTREKVGRYLLSVIETNLPLTKQAKLNLKNKKSNVVQLAPLTV